MRVNVALAADAMITIGSATVAALHDRRGAAIQANAVAANEVIDLVYQNSQWNIQGVDNPTTGQQFNATTIAGVGANGVDSIREARAGNFMSVEVLTLAQFQAVSPYVLNRFYVVPE